MLCLFQSQAQAKGFGRMFTFALAEAVSNAKSFDQIDKTTRVIWSAYSQGLISDTEAQRAAETLEERKKATKVRLAEKKQSRAVSVPSRRYVDPARIHRRRSWCFGGAVPASVAVHYSPAELAVLSTIVTLLRQNPELKKTIKEIANISGTSIRTVRYTLKLASELGHLAIERRRISAFRNLPNKITLGSNEVLRLWVTNRRVMVQKPAPLKKQIDISNNLKAIPEANQRNSSISNAVLLRHRSTLRFQYGY